MEFFLERFCNNWCSDFDFCGLAIEFIKQNKINHLRNIWKLKASKNRISLEPSEFSKILLARITGSLKLWAKGFSWIRFESYFSMLQVFTYCVGDWFCELTLATATWKQFYVCPIKEFGMDLFFNMMLLLCLSFGLLCVLLHVLNYHVVKSIYITYYTWLNLKCASNWRVWNGFVF
jgi:hypothetical protein